MTWMTLLLIAAAATPVETESTTTRVATSTETQTEFQSYTQAYRTAAQVKKPMLVVLNPAQGADNKQVTVDTLRKDERISNLLGHYVVAVVDTTTEHGKKVQELFGAEFALPRVVVIDEAQKKQIFRTSQTMSNEELVGVLEKYRDGAAAVKEPVAPPVQWMQSAIPQDCPACRRAAMLRAASGLSY